MQVGQISTSSSTGTPGVSGCSSSWVWNGRYGLLSFASSLRCEARSQPKPTGVRGSFEPMNTTSLPAASNTRSTRKRSASVVSDDTHSFAATGGIEEKFRPLRARERPLELGAGHELFAGMADVKQHLRLLLPPVIESLQETVVEFLLQLLSVLGVEQGEVRIAVHLEPFLLRAGAQEAFEIAARMQPHAAPVGGGEQRRLDVLERRQARAVVLVDQAMAQRVAVGVGAVLLQLGLRHRRRAGDRLAGHQALAAARTDAVLHRRHLARIPAGEEVAQDAAVARELAVVVRRALP